MSLKKVISFSPVLLLFAISACSMRTESLSGEENHSVSFAEKLAMAPSNQRVIITGETPFGRDLEFWVGESYTSALGVVCKQVKVMNGYQNFAVCNQNESSQQNKDNWVVIPSL